MATYILVVNDVAHEKGTTTAFNVIDFLLRRRVWIFPVTAPNLRTLNVGDRLIVYAAGKQPGAKAFVAEMKVASALRPLVGGLKVEIAQIGLVWFSLWLKVRDIKRFVPPRLVKPLIPQLKFVTDKKNYGLAFRQGVKRIGEADARIITQ